MKLISIITILCIVSVTACASSYADSVAILKQGLIGAGSGAVASAMSGGRGDRVWQGALAGAGVTVIGGALLDMLTSPDNGRAVTYVRQAQPIAQRAIIVRPVRPWVENSSAYRRVYRTGFRNGYRRGYVDGYNDAVYGGY